MRTGFIGAGRVGCSLARWFKYSGIDVAGFYSPNSNAEIKSDFKTYSSPNDLIKHCDIVFITVTDSAVSAVWSGLDKTSATGKIICHCSGSLSSDIFINAAEYGILTCSLHPMQAFDSRNVPFDVLQNTFFTIEGSGTFAVRTVIEKCGAKCGIIDSGKKPLYHAAAVFASNYITALAHKAVMLLCDCGFSYDDALSALKPMLMSNIKNVCEKGAAAALTGPVERNDTTTIEKHLNSLSDGDRALYTELARATADLAKLKHPDNDYKELYQLLED